MIGSIYAVFLDHYTQTRKGLLNPSFKKVNKNISSLWAFLKRWLGPNAGKYLYYVAIHPYNKLQLVAILIIPIVYIPILLFMDFGVITQILVLTMLAAIPVALLAMGMANMFGYEHREMLAAPSVSGPAKTTASGAVSGRYHHTDHSVFCDYRFRDHLSSAAWEQCLAFTSPIPFSFSVSCSFLCGAHSINIKPRSTARSAINTRLYRKK